MDNIAFISILFILAGSLCLILAIYLSYKLIAELPNDSFKKGWQILTYSIVFFIFSYWFVVFLISQQKQEIVILFTSFVIFAASIYIYYVCNLSSRTLVSLKRIDVLEREIVKDELMGIYNRRYFMSRLKEEFERYKRYQLPFSLLLIDIDHFKKVNDTYGHVVGDKCLIKLARLISKNLRPTDIFARYGGEEMAILLPNTWQTDAKNVADKIRVIVEEKNLDIDISNEVETLFLNCTISIGVSTTSKDLTKGNDIVKLADEALYLAKAKGRNVVIVHGDK